MRRGFTLIELLVVITIVLILAGLLLVGGQMAMKQARQAGTVQRIEGVNRALSQLGQVEGSGVYVIQSRLHATAAGSGGVLLIDYPNDLLDVAPTPDPSDAASAKAGQWLDYTVPYHLRFPWGQVPISYTATGPSRTQPPESFALSQMNPLYSQALLELAELLPPAEPQRYQSDRNPDQAWNDRWGNPLIVAYALYQYGAGPGAANEAQPPSGRFNWQWKLAKEAFGYTRSAYLVTGSAGPRPGTTAGAIH
jgi:prepilin-type N-terminal cleavage/methylation domain-containing protein